MSLVEDFEQRYAEYFRRVGERDTAFLEATLDPGFFSSDPLGVRREKTEYIAFCEASFTEPLMATFTDSRVREIGDVVIFSTQAELAGPHPLGGPRDSHTVRLLSVWQKQNGSWHYIAQQGTLLGAETHDEPR